MIQPKQVKAVVGTIAFFALWTATTWFFEGRIRTFLRPEAVVDRLVYIVIVNYLVGTVGAAYAIRLAIRSGQMDRADVAFRTGTPSVRWIFTGVIVGLCLLFVQGTPSKSVVVIANAFAQVLPVSIAEVLVCWAVIGGIVKGIVIGPAWLKSGVAALVSSAAFAVYHFGHSPPFNNIAMVAFLAFVGLWTSIFFLVSQDVYATIAFHNLLGVYGVVQALVGSGQADSFAELRAPLLIMAATALVILVAVDFFWVHHPQRNQR